jgi:hypothetical protein
VIKHNLESLLQQQNVYWKQRGVIKWVKFGDECTRFFHANATIKYKKNSIAVLTDRAGVPHYSHESKASIIWDSFKERLGQSEYTQMYFDLDFMISPVQGLEWLQDPFTKQQIDAIISNLPSNKAPGLTGLIPIS